MDFWSAFRQSPTPPWSDPTKYPRHVEITDDEALMLVTTWEHKQEEETALAEQIRDLHERYTIATSEREIAATKLFQLLRTKHPTVAHRAPSGFRKHESRYYYVSWDPDTLQQHEKES
jgi:hypothetical protein